MQPVDVATHNPPGIAVQDLDGATSAEESLDYEVATHFDCVETARAEKLPHVCADVVTCVEGRNVPARDQ